MVIITPNQGQKHGTLRPLPDAVPEAWVEQPCGEVGREVDESSRWWFQLFF